MTFALSKESKRPAALAMFHHHYLCRPAINQENVVGGSKFRLDLLYRRHRFPAIEPAILS
jgi:hypothetical protein